MASLINMYSSSEAPEISGALRSLRQEERDRDAKNWQGSRDLLRSVATDDVRKKYGDGLAWDGSVKNADAVFKKQYERLMSVDPAAAAQLAEDYKAEREKRVAQEVSEGYKAKSAAQDPELKALEDEIAALDASIASSEMEAQEAAQNVEALRQEDLRAPQESAMSGYTPAMSGYTPQAGSGGGLRAFYGAYPPQPESPFNYLTDKFKTTSEEAKIRPPFLTDMYKGGM